MEGTSLTTAKIIDQDHSKTITCLFNPKEYTFSKQNSWKQADSKGTNLGQYEFGSGQPTTLQMQLFFDTYADAKDVRKAYTEAIWEMMKVDPGLANHKSKKGRPPIVIFQWGSTWSFKAVITSIRERFTLFLSDGTPVRSTLDVSFQQIRDKDDHPPTNPTSGGVGGERIWTVSGGDTLAWIAYKEYGDPNLWRLIADANKLTKVRQLMPGIALEIPNA